MNRLFLAFALCAATNASALSPYCLAEIEAQERAVLTAQQTKRLEFLKRFNSSMSERIKIGYAVVYAHRGPAQRHQEIDVDDSPVSACLLKAFADVDSGKDVAPFAQEGYALRLLSGSGVPKDRQAAKQYLERAALEYRYASAAVRLARLHLEDAPSPGALESAIRFAKIAVANRRDNPPGSVDADEARAVLLEAFAFPKHGPALLSSEQEYYISQRSEGWNDKLILAMAKRHPEFEREWESRNRAREVADSIATSARCRELKSRYDSCRIKVGGGYGATLRACGPEPSCR